MRRPLALAAAFAFACVPAWAGPPQSTLPSFNARTPFVAVNGVSAQALADILGQTVTAESQGAYGDGVTVTKTTSISSGATALFVSSAQFSASDYDPVTPKYIEVPGAGAAGATLVTTIAGYVSPTQITLAAPAATSLSGASTKITYGHDDTVAVQAASNVAKFVELISGRTYLVKNLTTRSVATVASIPMAGFISRSGQASIRAISGGDASYLVATPNWVSNQNFSDNGFLCRNVTFDGGGIVQDVFVNQSYGSIYDQCYFRNGTRYGYWGTRTTKNGTALSNTTENTQFIASGADANGSDGVHLDNGLTDSQIRGGFYFNNGGWSVYAGTGAGLIMTGTHEYGDTSGALYVATNYGFGTVVSGNDFEEPVTINAMSPTSSAGTFGPGNTIEGRLSVNFTDNTNYSVFRSLGNTYMYTGSRGANGHIYQGYNGALHTIISDHDNFETATPFVWNGGSVSSGRIYANKSYAKLSAGAGAGVDLMDGWQLPSSSATAPTDFHEIKSLSNTGTTTTYTFQATVPASDAGGFVASGKLKIFSQNAAKTAVESYGADVWVEYIRTTGTVSSKNVTLTPHGSNDPSPTISVAAAISDTTVNLGNNVVTVTFTITHPQANDTTSSIAVFDMQSTNHIVSIMKLL